MIKITTGTTTATTFTPVGKKYLAFYMRFDYRNLKQRESCRPGRQKWRPEVDICSLSALTRQIHTTGAKTKVLRFVVRDRGVPSSETSNFRLLFLTSRCQFKRWIALSTG